MTITFYITDDPVNKIQKTLTGGVSVSGVLREATTEDNPVIKAIEGANLSATDKAKLRASNYAYIAELGKYYFVDNKFLRNDKLIDIPMNIDTLMTFASDILNQTCLIQRSEVYSSPYINDSERPAYNFPMVLTKNFSGSYEGFHMYLTVASSQQTQ